MAACLIPRRNQQAGSKDTGHAQDDGLKASGAHQPFRLAHFFPGALDYFALWSLRSFTRSPLFPRSAQSSGVRPSLSVALTLAPLSRAR
jgi:hypothetical protein